MKSGGRRDLSPKKFKLDTVDVLKHALPRLVPFFKTFCIYFILWLPEAENPSIFSAVIKVLPILSLCGFVSMQDVNLSMKSNHNRLILLGLIFSLFGDIFLVWEFTHFNYGVVSFGLAHVCYASAMGLKPLNPIVFVSLIVPTIHTYYLYYPKLEGILVVSVAVYMLTITIMIWRSITALHVSLRNDQTWQWTKLCACAGAVSFGISDFILGLNKFCISIPHARAVIMVTYYGAQLGIALSSFTISRDAKKQS